MGEDVLGCKKSSDLETEQQQQQEEQQQQMCNENSPAFGGVSEAQYVCQKLENFRAKILCDFEKHFSCMIDEMLQDMRRHELQRKEFRHFASGKLHECSSSSSSSSLRLSSKLPANSEATNKSLSATRSPAQTTDSVNMVKDLLDKRKQRGLETRQSTASTATSEQTMEQSMRRSLPEKEFIARESFLTALLQVDHMKTIYHIFYIILIIFLLNTIAYDYFTEGRVNLGLGTFKAGLKRIHWVLGVWLVEHIFVFLFYLTFSSWAHVRAKLKPASSSRRLWSHGCLLLHICTQLVFSYVSSTLCLHFDLPFVSASVLLLESIRLMMKMHAFLRYNAARIVRGKLKADKDDNDNQASGDKVERPIVPSFHCFLYFLFAPTLIYRDHYPRTSQIRWKFALNRFLEVVAVAFLYSFIYERHISAHFEHFGREPLTASMVIIKIFGMMLPSIVIFLCGFYLILHSWLNFTAELLRFADRMFYKDWWTSHNYDAYYRNWNIVVHDWLYEYVYKDFYIYVFKGSKLASSLSVFIISALVHEQVLGFALQLFFPAMFFFFFVVGVSLVFLMRKAPKSLGNMFLWFSLITGNCCLISLYSMEYFARQNCQPMYDNWWLDRMVPGIWNCYVKHLSKASEGHFS